MQVINNNRASTEFSGPGGIGGRASPLRSITVIANAAGEVARISADMLYGSQRPVGQGIYVQNESAHTVQVDATLAAVDIALNPKHDTSSTLWKADTTVAIGALVKLQNPIVNCLRITFAQAGIFHILVA